MPTRTVNDHDDVLMRIAGRDLTEKQQHACPVDVRQREPIKAAIGNTDGGVSVNMLMGVALTTGCRERLEQQ